MKTERRYLVSNKVGVLALVSALMLSACVTINIYFPAAEAQKAADKIINDVWQLKDGVKAPDAVNKEAAPATK